MDSSTMENKQIFNTTTPRKLLTYAPNMTAMCIASGDGPRHLYPALHVKYKEGLSDIKISGLLSTESLYGAVCPSVLHPTGDPSTHSYSVSLPYDAYFKPAYTYP